MIFISSAKSTRKKKLWCVISVLLLGVCLFFVSSKNLNNNTKNNDLVNNKIGNCDKFISHKIQDNSVLLVEVNSFHHECMPGYARYYTELGYQADVFLLKNHEDSFSYFEPKDKLNLFVFDSHEELEQKSDIISKKIKDYKYVFVNTLYYYPEIEEKLDLWNLPQALYVVHNTEQINNNLVLEELLNKNKLITLADLPVGVQINPHYFGEFNKNPKNSMTNFIVIGNMHANLRNYDLLMDSVRKLKNNNQNFVVTVVGRDSNINVIPEDIRDKFDFKGKLSYKEMYDEVIKSDFILMLLDSSVQSHLDYKTVKSSGNIQLSYGFTKPVIISEDFADFYKFNGTNSLIYNNNNLMSSLEIAIKLTKKEYLDLQNNLELLSQEIFNQSLNNLRDLIS